MTPRSAGELGAEVSHVNNVLNIIGQGRGQDFRLHELLHVTVNANGEVTTVVERTSSSC